MRLCINQITAGNRDPNISLDDLARDLAAMRRGGWDAIELWLPHWDGVSATPGLVAARRALEEAGLVASGACAQPGLIFSEGEALRRHRDELVRRLEQCQALGAPHLGITPGTPGDPGVPAERSLATLDRGAENLRRAADLAAPYGVRLGIEFLKGVRFVSTLPTALLLAQRVAHPQVGVVVDTFHLYAGMSKTEDLDRLAAAPGQLSFVHVNDVPEVRPREAWTDPDRVLPGEGTVPLGEIFERLRRSAYDGYVSLELFNAAFADAWRADAGEAAREAYVRTAALLEGSRA
jgi:sugar phosphate isomerase/epimerase